MPAAEVDDPLRALAGRVAGLCRARGLQLATAESCTGGWIAKVLTDLPGSSAWFGTGLVTYSNAAKTALLDVPPALLLEHGAVSEAVVRRMASGLLARTGADLGVAVSGIAGPDGGTADKPVGLVWLAWGAREAGAVHVRSAVRRFDGDREAVRRAAVAAALEGLLVP